LEKGDIVYLKISKLQNKLQPQYHGPYTIDGQTKHGNYWLVNEEKKRIKNSYPRSKLKFIEKASGKTSINEDNIYFIEKIITHKPVGRGYRYLVKWKDFPESENAWIPASHFVSPILIDDYWNSITSPAVLYTNHNTIASSLMNFNTFILCYKYYYKFFKRNYN